MANPTYQYSNDFDLLRVLPALVDRVKWLVDAGTPSKSGRYFDDGSFHALVTSAHLREIQSNAAMDDAAFTAYRTQLIKSVILRALNQVFPQANAIEQVVLSDLDYTNLPAEMPQGIFSGYEIRIASLHNTVVKIESAILRFSQNTNVKLYLYVQGDATPLWEQTIAAVAGQRNVAQLIDCYISYYREKSAVFYFGYKPAELQNGAIPMPEDRCYENPTRIFSALPVRADAIPMRYGNVQYPARFYGLNLEMKSQHDHTASIEKFAHAFDELIGLTMAATILEMGIFTQRKNADQRVAADQAMQFATQMDLMGTLPISDAPRMDGLRTRVAREAERVRKSFYKPKTGVGSIY